MIWELGSTMDLLCAQPAQHLPVLEAEGAQSHEHKSLSGIFSEGWRAFLEILMESL